MQEFKFNISVYDSSTPSSSTAAPTSSQVLDEQNLIENRPRASSSPASAQLSVRAVPNHFGGVSHYGTNPRKFQRSQLPFVSFPLNWSTMLYILWTGVLNVWPCTCDVACSLCQHNVQIGNLSEVKSQIPPSGVDCRCNPWKIMHWKYVPDNLNS